MSANDRPHFELGFKRVEWFRTIVQIKGMNVRALNGLKDVPWINFSVDELIRILFRAITFYWVGPTVLSSLEVVKVGSLKFP